MVLGQHSIAVEKPGGFEKAGGVVCDQPVSADEPKWAGRPQTTPCVD